MLERVVALEPDGVIDARHRRPTCGEQTGPGTQDSTFSLPALAYQNARAEFERDYMRRLLEAAGGNMSEAARSSGIPRQNLYVRMKRWGFVTD